MKPKENQPNTFEEIVFETHNKAYGAFLLRTTYARTVAISMIVTVFVFSFVVSWAMWNARSKVMFTTGDRPVPFDTTFVIPTDPPPDLPPDKEFPAPEKPFLKPVVVDTAVESSMTTQGELTGNANPPIAEGTDPGTIDSVAV